MKRNYGTETEFSFAGVFLKMGVENLYKAVIYRNKLFNTKSCYSSTMFI